MKYPRERWIAIGVTAASVVVVAALFALYAYKRRWIADDGLIYVRVVRQILDGNGPVFNAFERTEANTSALWPWLVALFGLFSYENVEHIAVWLGGACAVGGFVLALDATRRFQRDRGYIGPLVPGAAFIIVAVFSFWDFATSGLESGLSFLWVGAAWWLLVSLTREPTLRWQRFVAVIFGLAPLVRPDLGLTMLVFLVAGWLILRPARRRTIELFLYAIAVPVAFEIFRAGFYGTLVPLPALAKSATHAEWGRGIDYLTNFLRPYRLWLPLLVLAGCFGFAMKRWSDRKTDRILIAAPVVAALLSSLYIIRVGGDFMHGRMWLPVTFLLIAPALLLPVNKLAAPAFVVLAGWGIHTCRTTNEISRHVYGQFVNDERHGYALWTSTRNPVDERRYVRALGDPAAAVQRMRFTGQRRLATEGIGDFPLGAQVPAPLAYVAGRLGVGGSLMNTDEIVVDTLGLANPIGARITVNLPGEMPGHQKQLTWPWLFADFSDATHDHDQNGASAVNNRAARHAMSCGALAEMLASVREPLTVGRFFKNLFGSIGRTRLVVPADPIEAEWKFCGPTASTPKVLTSSSHEADGWTALSLIDGDKSSLPTALGYTSVLQNFEPHEEWVELHYLAKRPIGGLELYPRTDAVGTGFPVAFTIETWDGTRWVSQLQVKDQPKPTGSVAYRFTRVMTDRIRLRVTDLALVPSDGRVLQLAELAALP